MPRHGRIFTAPFKPAALFCLAHRTPRRTQPANRRQPNHLL